MIDPTADAERLVRCFDPDAALVEGASEILVISPRYGRIRRRPPLLASVPASHGADAVWRAARRNLLSCSDRSVQLALATYQHRIRMRAQFSLDLLRDGRVDLHAHCHRLLERCGHERCAVPIAPEGFWIRYAASADAGGVLFEFGNTFLVPITPSALHAEARTLLGPRS